MHHSLTGTNAQPSLKYAWYVVGLLTLANISSFLDRQILALLVAPIKRDMHLSDTKVSLLMGLSFAMFYTIFGILIGRFADRTNRRNIIITGITLWSLLTSLCAGVKNYTQFFLARMGVGVGEATLSPSAYSIITDYFPKRKLGIALSVFTMGIFLGSGLALAIGAGLVSKLPTEGMLQVPLLGSIYHWQKLFLIIGLPGLFISILMFTVKEPARKDLLQNEGAATKPGMLESLKIVFKYPKTYLSICLGTSFTAFVSYGCTAWVPTYFNRTFGWPVPKAGLYFGLVLLAASISGVLWGGWYADKLKSKNILNGRVRVGLIATIVILLSCFIPLINNPAIVMALFFIPLFFVSSPMGASTTAIQELMPNQVRALSSSIFLFVLNMIGLGLGPLLVAFFTDNIFHNEKAIRFSLSALFLIGGGLGTLFYFIGYKGYKKVMEQKEQVFNQQ
ncbi:MAG: MFS transporter [Sphingobacteriales bacterium]|nr:MAG: MFS transporter [Sphingobacteriales bacterium]